MSLSEDSNTLLMEVSREDRHFDDQYGFSADLSGWGNLFTESWPNPACSCGNYNCAGEDHPPEVKLFTRNGAPGGNTNIGVWQTASVNLNVLGQQKYTNGVNAYGAQAGLFVWKRICDPGQKRGVDSLAEYGVCVNITGTISATLSPTTCTSPCSASIVWSSNSNGTVDVTRDGATIWSGSAVSGSNTDTNLTASGSPQTYNYCLVGHDGAGNHTNLGCSSVQVPPPPPPPLDRTLIVTVSGTGSVTGPNGINCTSSGGTCSALLANGTAVALSANPTTVIWGGDCDSTGRVTMTDNKTCTATFSGGTPNPRLSVVIIGNGTVTGASTINCVSNSGTCSEQIVSGTTVTLAASPSANLLSWSGTNCNDIGYGMVRFTITADMTCTATFKSDPILSVTIVGSGTVTGGGINCTNNLGTCTQVETKDSSVMLEATPGIGYSFQSWSGDCSNLFGSTAYLTMSANKSCTATFGSAGGNYLLSVSISGDGTVTGAGINCVKNTGTCAVAQGPNSTVTLSASNGTFISWGGDCNSSGQVTMTGNKSCSAAFETVQDCGYAAVGWLTIRGKTAGLANEYYQYYGLDITKGNQAEIDWYCAGGDNCTLSYGDYGVSFSGTQPSESGGGSSGNHLISPPIVSRANFRVTAWCEGSAVDRKDFEVLPLMPRLLANPDKLVLGRGGTTQLSAFGATYAGLTGQTYVFHCPGDGVSIPPTDLTVPNTGDYTLGPTCPNINADYTATVQVTTNQAVGNGTAFIDSIQPFNLTVTPMCQNLTSSWVPYNHAEWAEPYPDKGTQTGDDGRYWGWMYDTVNGLSSFVSGNNGNNRFYDDFNGTSGISRGYGVELQDFIETGVDEFGNPVGYYDSVDYSNTVSAKTAYCAGNIIVKATVNSAAYYGPLNYQLTNQYGNPAINQSAPSLPSTNSDVRNADWTIAYISGAPAGAILDSITDALGADITTTRTQTLPGAVPAKPTITFNLNFIDKKTLSISKIGSGSGTVTSDTGGIVCGSTCGQSYDTGTTVTLTATPDTSGAGSVITGWTVSPSANALWGCNAGSTSCTVAMDSNTNATAIFDAKLKVNLVVNPTPPRVDPYGGILTAAVTGIAGGTINYSFWYDCSSLATTLAAANTACGTLNRPNLNNPPPEGKCQNNTIGLACDLRTSATQVAPQTGSFTYSAGPHTAKVIVDRAGMTSESHVTFMVDANITLSKGTSNGTCDITSNPIGISCGTSCTTASKVFPYSTTPSITLSAVASADTDFLGWAGCTSTTGTLPNQTCNVAPNASKTITATCNLHKPHIVLSPASFSFSGTSESSTPFPRTIRISNTGSAVMNWNSSLSQPWCHLSSASGTINGGAFQDLNLTVDAPTNVGTFGCTLTVSDPNADNDPQTASISYSVAPGKVKNLSIDDTQSEKLIVSWTAPTYGSDSYIIFRKSCTSVADCAVAETTPPATSYKTITATSFTENYPADISLLPTRYIYWVETFKSGILGPDLVKAGPNGAHMSPPSDPSNFMTDNSTCERINLSWTDNSINEAGFKLYRSKIGKAGSTNLVDYDQIAMPGANTTSFTDFNATADQVYTYAVVAYNAGGDSATVFSVQVMNNRCVPNLQLSQKRVDQVLHEGSWAPYTGQPIFNGDTLKLNIIITNNGTSSAYKFYVIDSFPQNLIYQPGTALLKQGGNPPAAVSSVTQSGSAVTFGSSAYLGTKANDGMNWQLTFDALINSVSPQPIDFVSNSAVLHFSATATGPEEPTVTVKLIPIAVSTGQAKTPNIKEVAP